MTSSQVLVQSPQTTGDQSAGRYSLLLTAEPAVVDAAQRLRHRVFAGELGARLPHPFLDRDRFDAHCDHLVVREDGSGEIVGTYRMLPPERAAAAGALYAESEFAIDALAPLRPSLVETGRSCVHPDHRNGAVIGLVWAGLARYMFLTGNRWLIGCASVPLTDGGGQAAHVWQQVQAKHLAPAERRVTPLNPWQPVEPVKQAMPPLLRGYLRLGAQVCGPPSYDPDFDCADFLILLDVENLDQRYLRFFLGDR